MTKAPQLFMVKYLAIEMSAFVSLIVIHSAFKSGANYKSQKILEEL